MLPRISGDAAIGRRELPLGAGGAEELEGVGAAAGEQRVARRGADVRASRRVEPPGRRRSHVAMTRFTICPARPS